MTNKMENDGIVVLYGSYLHARQLQVRSDNFSILRYLAARQHGFLAATDAITFWRRHGK